MKYFLALFISVLLLTGCNDGNLITENFVFENAIIQKCASSNVLYKINDVEALILNTPESSFPNVETVLGTPRVVTITGTTSLIYRKFASTTTSTNICDTPTIPVLEEWTVSGGTMEITTNKVLDGSGITVAYNHNIVFKNITFVAPDKQVVYDSYVFGNYRTDVVNLNFDYALVATQNCGGNNLIFKYNSNNALLLDVDPTLFINAVTPVGFPRTRVINSTTNKVVYRVYSGSLNSAFFCAAITPSVPTLTEEWVAQDGIAATSGEIRVETVAFGAQFKHTITLYKTTFKKGVLTYIYSTSDNFVFGEYTTP
jgi:hypothetical protein